jgi:hypothetical protein
MAADPQALLTQLNEIRALLRGDSPTVVTPDLLARLQGLTGQIKGAVDEAKANLEREIHATAAELQAKAAAMRKPPPAPAPPRAPAPLPHPWEDHQGLDAMQLQGMVEALLQLGRSRR